MLQNEFTADLREVIADDPTPFTWWNTSGQEQLYNGLFSAATELNQLVPGGYQPEIDASMYCAHADMPYGKPLVGDTLRIKGRNYRIVSFEEDHLRVGINYLLNTAEK